MNFRHSILLAIAFLLLATPAEAKQFKKLLELGQVVSGNDQPVTEIVEPTIGQDGQVAVLLKTNPVQTGTGPFTVTTFKGVYAISRNGQIRLLEGGITTNSFRSGNRQEFSAPSISEGKIAYLAMEQIITPAANNFARDTKLRVGTPGAVKTILPLKLSNAVAESGKPNLAFVNGKAYFVDDLFAAGASGNDSGNGKIVGVVGLVNTLSPTPSLLTLSSDPPNPANPPNGRDGRNRQIRASAKTLLLSRGFPAPGQNSYSVLLESPGNSSFTSLQTGNANPAACGFSASLDNVVTCSAYGYNGPSTFKVSVRFGQQGQFTPLFTGGYLSSISGAAISHRSVIFQTIEYRQATNIKPAATVETIYLSQNGQVPSSLVSGGDVIDGKTVANLRLSENNRTIAGNSAVFTATFTDGTKALYRVDF